MLAGLPVGVGHGELVEVGEQRRDHRVGRPRHPHALPVLHRRGGGHPFLRGAGRRELGRWVDEATGNREQPTMATCVCVCEEENGQGRAGVRGLSVTNWTVEAHLAKTIHLDS